MFSRLKFICINLSLCIFVSLLYSCTTAGNSDRFCSSGVISVENKCSPFRTGVLLLNSELDHIKPVSSFPFGGYGLAEDLVIAEFRDGWMGAYSLKSRAYKWWLELHSNVSSTIAVLGGSVVATLNNGRIIKINVLTGEKTWDVDFGKISDRSPVLNDQTLFIQSADNQIFALDYSTGQKLWVYDGGTSDQLSMRSASIPVIFDKKVFFGTSKGEVHIVDMQSGLLLRKITLPLGSYRFKDVVGEIVVQGGEVLFAKYDGSIGRVSYDTPTTLIKWKRELSSISSTLLREGIYYVGCTNGDIYAFDAKTGLQKWDVKSSQTVESITPVGGILLISGSNGQISSINANSGVLEWTDRLDATMAQNPLIFGDKAYFGTGLKALYSYKIR